MTPEPGAKRLTISVIADVLEIVADAMEDTEEDEEDRVARVLLGEKDEETAAPVDESESVDDGIAADELDVLRVDEIAAEPVELLEENRG